MNIISYCDTMGEQLSGWKAKIHDVIHHAEKMPVDVKTQFGAFFEELDSLMDELDNSLHRLANECPVEWSEQRDTITDRLGKMQRSLAGLSEKVGLPDSIAWL